MFLKGNTSNFKGGALFVEDGVTVQLVKPILLIIALIMELCSMQNWTDDSVNILTLDQNLIVHNGRDGTGGFEDRYVIDMYNNSGSYFRNDLAVRLMFNTDLIITPHKRYLQ